MALSIKTKQVFGVTVLVGLAVILLSGWYLTSLATVWLGETRARAELLSKLISQRAFDAIRAGGDPILALKYDTGLQSILQGTAYDENVLYAEVVDTDGHVIQRDGGQREQPDDLAALMSRGTIAQIRAIYTPHGQSFEYSAPLPKIGDTELGTVRVGVSALLLRKRVEGELRAPLITAVVFILLSSFVAMLLAQLTLRPIHVIRSGLARLGRGELDVDVDLPGSAELADLGDSFKAVSARLAADRSTLGAQRATLESVVDNLEDAVALFDPSGTLLFANPAMQPALAAEHGRIDELLPDGHPYRVAVETALATRESLDPSTVQVPGGGERLLLAHPVEDAAGELIGVMVVARNLTYISQVESTLSYSRKLAALGRLSAGIAHEVKNPLNATMIHLELLKMQLADSPGALEHLAVIATQVRRLDEVVQGFLKFTRPEDLQLQPVALGHLVEEILPIVSAEASKSGVDVRVEFPPDLPPASADPGLLQQALLNLALDACQAMPHGGRLRLAGSRTPAHQIAIEVEDTGVGIPPADLARIFDLYFTTKEHGSGIGLSLVYRTVQLHDGEIEVQSAPGRGTTFRLLLREAPPTGRRTRPASGPLGLREAAEGDSAHEAPAS
jgi:signal transduction histidine kinase